MSTEIDEASSLIETRLANLEMERTQLENALQELGGGIRRSSKMEPTRPTNDGQRNRGMGGPKKRKRRGGTRSEHALAYIEWNPGASASDIAQKLKIHPNYVYRVLGELQKEGRVRKDGRRYISTQFARSTD
jgi:hypothetical protein